MFAVMLRSLPAGFIAPCLPTKADTLPSGEAWLHEIKHDGFRVTSSAFYRLALACGEARPS
jgi:ATP-dependent DNA ligase